MQDVHFVETNLFRAPDGHRLNTDNEKFISISSTLIIGSSLSAPHEPAMRGAAFMPLQLTRAPALPTLKRRERRAPVQGFNARNFVSGNSLPARAGRGPGRGDLDLNNRPPHPAPVKGRGPHGALRPLLLCGRRGRKTGAVRGCVCRAHRAGSGPLTEFAQVVAKTQPLYNRRYSRLPVRATTTAPIVNRLCRGLAVRLTATLSLALPPGTKKEPEGKPSGICLN
jgi:hypothetical protein